MAQALHISLFFSLATVCCVVYSLPLNPEHNHYHYYAEVTNNIHHNPARSQGDTGDDRGYRFHIGDSALGAYVYLNDAGETRGVYIDFLLSVCKRAGKKCYYMIDDFDRCWAAKGEDEKPGIGLLLGAYDGCIGMLNTPERRNSFNFTSPFVPQPKTGLFYKSGSVPTDPAAIGGRKLGFVNGWALNAKCVRRAETLTGDFEPVFFDNHKAVIQAVVDGKVDAAVSAANFDGKTGGVEQAGPLFDCGGTGLGVMTHWGSDVPLWWNEAATSLVDEYGWKKLCDVARENHGDHGEIFCIE